MAWLGSAALRALLHRRPGHGKRRQDRHLHPMFFFDARTPFAPII
jgi:hypothetical protein